MIFEELTEFRKDMKFLSKKFRTLERDVETVKCVISICPEGKPPFSFPLSHLPIKNCIIKVKKIACMSLKGRGVNSGFRLIYAYFPIEKRVVLIELYHKNDKSNEDRERILHHFR